MMKEVWDSSRLDPKLVDYYLAHAKKLWPENAMLKYSEDIALQFLKMKDYRIEEAVLALIYDKYQIHRLIDIHNHERLDEGKMQLELDQSKLKQPSERELRARLIRQNLANWIQENYQTSQLKKRAGPIGGLMDRPDPLKK